MVASSYSLLAFLITGNHLSDELLEVNLLLVYVVILASSNDASQLVFINFVREWNSICLNVNDLATFDQ